MVKPARLQSIGIPACLLLSALCVRAANTPHIGYVYPAGGQQGTAFEVRVGGQYIEKTDEVIVSGTGVVVKVLEYIEPERKRKEKEPLKPKEDAVATNKVAATTTNGVTAAVTNTAAMSAATNGMNKVSPPKPWDVRMKKMGGKKQKNSQIDDTVRLAVTIAPDAPSGEREIRLSSPLGISNPLLFHVGVLPEMTETEENYAPNCKIASLPVLVNGQILPGETKSYLFAARKGTHLVARVEAQSLIPYLADAVPGWFHAVLALTDPKGKLVAFAGDYRFSPDPVLFYDVPQDGDYTLAIRDSIYRGREDFVYRLSIGELPFIQDVFPLGGPAGATLSVALTGVNLPTNRLKRVNGKAGEPILISLQPEKWFSDRIPFAADALPEAFKTSPNNGGAGAQTVNPPVILNGRIAKPGEEDVFRFEGKKGDKLVIEVYARRLGSPIDSIISLTDAGGKTLAANDDHEDKGAGLTTHQADSYLTCEIPTNGAYYVHLGDVQGRGGDAYAYRLRISAPQPDFDLRVVPSAINVAQDRTAPITVYALRKDGFRGEIRLSAKNMPCGYSMKPAVITNNAESLRLNIFVPEDTPLGCVYPILDGTATIQGTNVMHTAIPADDMIQAFAYHHLVPAQELVLDVLKASPITLALDLPKDKPLQIPLGGFITVAVKTTGKPFNGKTRLVLDRAPNGLTLDEIVPESGCKKADVVFRADDDELDAGFKGTLILLGITGQKTSYTSPPIPFEITGTEAGGMPEAGGKP